ncbi:MAG: BREX system ATP-binding domain-containing protein [Moorellales bacterium]
MVSSLVRFLRQEYLEGFIAQGGSKIKLYTSTEATRRALFFRELSQTARDLGYAVAEVDAVSVARLHQLNNLYHALTARLDLEGLFKRYCDQVIRALGYNPADLPPHQAFLDWAAEVHGRVPESLRSEIRLKLETDIFRNRAVSRSFATVALQLSADALGATDRRLLPEDRELLFAWLRGQPVALRDLRKFHVFTRVDRYNARLFLGSLVELARLAGYRGLFVTVDNLEVLLTRRETGRPLYGRAAREEFYESLRQFIDDLDTLHHLMLVLGFQRDLVDNPTLGFRSYAALWLRIQSEIEGTRPNLFRDFLDLDRLSAEAAAPVAG